MPEKTLLEGKKILIVDDEPDVLDTLEELLGMFQRISPFSTMKKTTQLRTSAGRCFAVRNPK